MTKLSKKIALITGGARGMGSQHVRRFIEEGAKVYFTDILSEEGEKLAAGLGPNAIFITHDVSSEDEWKKVIGIIEKNEEKLDVLVNNAGIVMASPISETSLDVYKKVIGVNQISVFLGMKYALPLLKKSGNASIINISSIAGLAGSKGNAAYSSSKYAVRGLTQTAALEFAPFHIRVNSVHPGVVATPMIEQEDSQELVEALSKAIPLGKIGQPDDLTSIVLLLASDDSAFCTASEFVVDGGSLAGF
ncbi:SDR family oxidoreductase [Olivibacter sp. XZL3]|uniref:SDR family oxidoreductase n=1 Tax=Olivibacter sp. XZL3 TaxID=1735116 RepID=UPI001066EED7|nr:SDR family oxidoreductase [Olivibacter sp. XZL3]